MQKITPFLWFNDNAEEAAKFYCSIFKNSRIVNVTRSGNGSSEGKGAVMSLTFSLDGQEFHALNGGPHFKFTPAISLFVTCETQQEVDMFWDKLSEGGEKLQCGWLRDKFGLSWQVVPSILNGLMQDKDTEKSKRVMKALMQMGKLDIKALQEAAAGR